LAGASVAVEDEGAAVAEQDFDGFSGFAVLVEPVRLGWLIVLWNSVADGLPGRLDRLEDRDVEGRVGWWRDDRGPGLWALFLRGVHR